MGIAKWLVVLCIIAAILTLLSGLFLEQNDYQFFGDTDITG